MRNPRLAFVDVETTGLGARHHRIAEIGIVTADEAGVKEWGTLIDTGTRASSPSPCAGSAGRDDSVARAPRFREIAHAVAARLEGRLFIAHNARFDYAFLKSEFDRLAIRFEPRVLCTVMLSRKLYPQHHGHSLDALMERYGLATDERHRALPDARLLYQFWQALHDDFSTEDIDDAVDKLLAEPLLPAHLNLDLIAALPERPGVFVFLGENGRPLHLGRAANLQRHVKRYFQLDRNCTSANALSHQVRDIRCQVAEGPLDARLREIALRRELFGQLPSVGQNAVSIRIEPSAFPVAQIVPLSETLLPADDLFGIFGTERKARNVLKRIAHAQSVCHLLLGLPQAKQLACRECAGVPYQACEADKMARGRHLVRFLTAIAPAKLQSWPYRGAIAVREGRSVHVFDRWEHLGSVRAGSDVHGLLHIRRRGIDPQIFSMLQRALPRLSGRAVRNLPPAETRETGTADYACRWRLAPSAE